MFGFINVQRVFFLLLLYLISLNHILYYKLDYYISQIKGAFSGLRQFLVTKSPFKIMKNTFYFTLKALFTLKIFKLLS